MKFKIGDMVKILYREDERGNPLFPANVVGKVGHVTEVNKEAKKYYVHCYGSAAGSRWISEDSLELANKDVQQVYGPFDVQVVMPPLQEQKIRDAIDKAMKQGSELINGHKHDPVSKPKHYMLFEDKNIEVRDLMTLLANRLQTVGYSAMFISDYIQAMQYVLRFDQKNGKEDISKAVWYFNKMLESYPENKEVK